MALAVNLQCFSSPHSSWLSPSTSGKISSVHRRLVVAGFELKRPPYELDALEPHMSRRTLEHHWGKHHRAYVDNLNKQIYGSELEGKTLDEIIKIGYNNGNPTPYFNNAGQVWNHDFFWDSMKPGGGKKPDGEVFELIERDFGSFHDFLEEFKEAAATQFGSGWAWLVAKTAEPMVEKKFAKLIIEKTPNALNPLLLGHIPLLTIDVWEHAYYLDYQNRRPDYITTFTDELISWEMVAARLERAKSFLNFREPVIPD